MKTKIDGRSVSSSSKLRESCSKHTVSFKTKRGKVVTIRARPGGSSCGETKWPAKVVAWRRKFGKVASAAARYCKRVTGREQASCRRTYIRSHLG